MLEGTIEFNKTIVWDTEAAFFSISLKVNKGHKCFHIYV